MAASTAQTNREALATSRVRYEELYRTHIAAGVQLGYLLTGDHAAAEDAAQDAFLKAAGRLTGLSEPTASVPISTAA